ncbi:MAG TPA: tetratricopeptide repeat protein [Nitrospirota bacterium]|nr:tetratricopeptide repeat protein [Nitrospirota bacterium]
MTTLLIEIQATGMENRTMHIRNGFLVRMFRFQRMPETLFLAAMTMALAGCAAGAKTLPKPAETAPFTGPSVERLTNGQQGFVIHDNPIMNAESREDFGNAVKLLNDGKNEKAIELLSKVTLRSPGVAAPHIDIAVAYMRTGKTGPAEEHLKTALGLIPGHPVASNEYGLLLRRSGRFREAREVYQKEIARFPEYLPVHKNLGILLDLYMDDPEDALREFETYAAGAPSDTQVKTWIAELTMRLKR